MSIEIFPSVAKAKRNGAWQNLPGFVAQSGDADIEAMIANKETSTTAQFPHAKDSFFILNDILYQADADISVNGTIAVGTNCHVAVLGDEVTELINKTASQSDKIDEVDDTIKNNLIVEGEPLPLTLNNSGYAINKAGTGLVAAQGYSIYRAGVNDYVGKTLSVHVPNYDNYMSALYTDANGITVGHISEAYDMSTVPSNAILVCITLADNDTSSYVSIIKTTNEALSDKVDKDGIRQVTEDNCTFIGSKNLFNKATITSGYYVDQTTGQLAYNANFFASDYILIDSNKNLIYSNNLGIAGSRYAFYDANKQYIEGALFSTYITSPQNAKYIRISHYLAQVNEAQLEYGTISSTYHPYKVELDEKLLPTKAIQKTINNGAFRLIASTLTNNQKLETSVNNVKKNNVYTFFAKITSFTSLRIGHGSTQYESSFISIDNTNVSYVTYDPNYNPTPHDHELTISGFIYVIIVVKDKTAKVTIQTDGDDYSFDTPWNGCSNASSYVSCDEGSLTDCVFTWSCSDAVKPIWIFGDSYLNFSTNNRWTYYLKENEWLKNVLLNGFGGESSAQDYTSLENLLAIATPEAIIWTSGMNDGSDTASDPNSTWLTNIQKFIAKCESNNIVPILATIPTVPSVNNEKKNEWVRNSGYRYIDFAKAVGATSEGVWYTDMLSSDNVHPDVLGAKALFIRAINDVPEITYTK